MPRDNAAARDVLVTYAMEHFAHERAVLIADPTGFAKPHEFTVLPSSGDGV